MCLGFSQQVSHVNITDILILSTVIKPTESTCDLGVVNDTTITMSARVSCNTAAPAPYVHHFLHKEIVSTCCNTKTIILEDNAKDRPTM